MIGRGVLLAFEHIWRLDVKVDDTQWRFKTVIDLYFNLTYFHAAFARSLIQRLLYNLFPILYFRYAKKASFGDFD